jgi:hypothetical protein
MVVGLVPEPDKIIESDDNGFDKSNPYKRKWCFFRDLFLLSEEIRFLLALGLSNSINIIS